MKTFLSPHRERGMTLVEVFVVLAVGTFLSIIVLFGQPKGCRSSSRIRCVNNLKQTGLAFRVWEGDNNDKFPMEISETNGGTMEFTTGPNVWRHFQVMSNELSTPNVLICPADISRMSATNFTSFNNSNISFFVGLDATQNSPQDIWSGDHNLTNGTPIRNGILQLTTNRPSAWTPEIHNKVGNLLFIDGSVQQVSASGLRNAVFNSSAFSNRLQMPVLEP